MLSGKQREMLISFERDGEAADFADFVGRAPSALARGNRERVIDALRRKGLLDDDGITVTGGKAIERCDPRSSGRD